MKKYPAAVFLIICIISFFSCGKKETELYRGEINGISVLLSIDANDAVKTAVPFRIIIVMTAPEGTEMDLKAEDISSGNLILLRKESDSWKKQSRGQMKYNVIFTAEVPEPGKSSIGPVYLSGDLIIPETEIETESSLLEGQDFFDVTGPVKYPGLLKWQIILILSAAVTAAAGTAVMIILKKRKRIREMSPVEAAEYKLREMKEMVPKLKKGNWSGQDFYFRLTAVLREFLDSLYLLNLREQTTEELKPELKKIGSLTEEESAFINALFDKSVYIKYAARETDGSETGDLEKCLKTAEGLIEREKEKENSKEPADVQV